MQKTVCDNCGTEMGGPDYYHAGSVVLQPGNVPVELHVTVKPKLSKDICGRCCREALEMVYAKTERTKASA